MGKTGRAPSCLCGECEKCKKREKSRAAYHAMTVEERRAMRARRNPESVKAAEKRRHQIHGEKRRAKNREWAKKNPDKALAAVRAYRKRHPDRARAHDRLNDAVKDGKILRQPCEVCGALEVEAHHHDYSKPLDVRWLCLKHHVAEHYPDSAVA